MKSEVFEAKEEVYGEWSGKYVVKVLSGAESLTIEEVIFKWLQKKGIIQPKDYPIMLERKLNMVRCITRNGKPITNEDIDGMPKRLYMILFGLYQRLNVPSQEETDFLSKV